MLHLRTLGRLELESADGRPIIPVLSQPRRLALFVYLAAARPCGPHQRDALLPLFWAEADEASARHALNQALYWLRQRLGEDVFETTNREAVGLRADAVACDAVVFDAAVSAGGWSEALDLYRGDFLSGFHAIEAHAFNDWMELERSRLRQQAARAAWALATEQAERSAIPEARASAWRAARLAPTAESSVREFLMALAGVGCRADAVVFYEEWSRRLERDYELSPSAETRALAVDLRRTEEGTEQPVPTAPGQVPTNRAASITSLAVLPLDNLTGDPGQQYFVAGMHHALIAELSKITTLKVISRTSTGRFGGSTKPLPQVARELGVEGIIEGSVAREGDQVRVTVQLIHGPTDGHIWADSYQRELSGVLALQSEIARAITEQVRASVAHQLEVGAASTVDPASYDAYLRGIYHLSRLTAKDLTRAQTELRHAVQLDPLLARAHARLAETYVWLGYLGYPGAPPYHEAFATASSTVMRALELDPQLPEAHLTLGMIRWLYRPDLAAAERAVGRSLGLSPSLADAHQAHASLLLLRERYDDAIVAAERARELDPLASSRHAWLAWTYWVARRYDEAIRLAQEAIELDPTATRSYQALGGACVELGRLAEAAAAFEEGLARSGGDRIFLAHLGYVFARIGRTDDARKILAELIRFYRAGLPSPYYVAWTHMGLGERESALTWLETTYQEGWGHIAYLLANPVWEPLRSEPRFQALVRNVGLA